MIRSVKLNPLIDLLKPWWQLGRDPYLRQKDIDEVAANLNRMTGKTIAPDDINGIIQTNRASRLKEAGLVAIGGVQPVDRQTVTNYAALFASQPNVSITKTAIAKTITRFTAENSLASSMTLLLVVSATHFTPPTERSIATEKELEDATDGAKRLYKLIQDFYGGVYLEVAKPQYSLSTDDTVTFVFKGAKRGDSQWRMIGTSSLKNAGTNSNIAETTKGIRTVFV